MRVLGKDGYLPGVALFFEVNDEQLHKIRLNSQYYLDKDFLNELLASKGDNAHIYGLYSDRNNRFIDIYKHFKQLLKDYKSVSWWDKKEKQFKIRS